MATSMVGIDRILQDVVQYTSINSSTSETRGFVLQPMIPPKRFDIFPPDWGMLRRSRCVQSFL